MRADAPKGNQALANARALLKEGHNDASLAELRGYWLDHPNSIEAIELCALVMDEFNRAEAAQALTQLKEALSENSEKATLEDHPRAAFAAGYFMISTREYQLAVMLLTSCLASQPLDSTLNYELGFALMTIKKYEDAVEHFLIARKGEDDFDTSCNLAVCYSLLRKVKETKDTIGLLKKLAKTEDEKYELRHREIILKRLERLQRKKSLTERDWLYALYGTVELLPQDVTTSATIKDEKESYRSVASTLLILKGVLEGLSLVPEAIEFYNPYSRPLAAALARLYDIPLESYKGPDRPDHALLVLDWASDIIGPHAVFSGNMSNRSIFAYGLTPNDSLPLVPDIVARFLDNIDLPWSKTDGDDGKPTPEDAIPQILERAWNMESDPEILKIVQETVEYYMDKRELIVINNCAQFPQRAEYTAQVPSGNPSS
ncbi:MAG: hypothetical protein K2X93_20560 [Candidatus Obscuribacterales bacterium]|nr:hypothetical protein [Candidatus Obscuribacterales bacterium]